MRDPFGKGARHGRARNTLEKASPLALGSKQRKNATRSIVEETIMI